MGGGQDSTYEYFPKVCEHTWYHHHKSNFSDSNTFC
jgi:hypothetical protein